MTSLRLSGGTRHGAGAFGVDLEMDGEFDGVGQELDAGGHGAAASQSGFNVVAQRSKELTKVGHPGIVVLGRAEGERRLEGLVSPEGNQGTEGAGLTTGNPKPGIRRRAGSDDAVVSGAAFPVGGPSESATMLSFFHRHRCGVAG